MSSGRSPARSDVSATRAARLAERTDAYVVPASTSVPPAVASAEIVTQSAMRGHLYLVVRRPPIERASRDGDTEITV